MRKLLSIFSLALLYFTVVYGQAAVSIPITVGDNTGLSAPIYFGLDLTATDGIDEALGEAELPGPPPAGYYAAWLFPDFVTQSYYDYRAPGNPPAFPFTGHVSYMIRIQTDYPAGNPMTVSWSLPPQIAATSTIGVSGNMVSFSGTGSHTWNYNPALLTIIYVEVDFVNIGPAGPAPIFEINPTSLSFGSVNVGSNSTLPVTVSNPGTADLNITNIASSDGQFTFAPSAPQTIPAGGNLLFNITFAPTSAGPKSGNITFTHNAGSPFVLPVSGTGVEPGPTFRVVPTSLNFGNVGVGTPKPLTVTVYNDGSVNAMNITSASCTPGVYTVSPSNAVIPAMGSQVFTVTFTPTTTGIVAGTLTFQDNAPGSPHTVGLTGNGVAENGLIFQKDTVYQLENNSYMEIIQLKGLTANAKAIQFRLETNKAVDDNTILTFQSITKGTNVADPSWILEVNVVRGPITSNGASKDEIFVLLYNINQGPGWAMGPGDYNDLFHVNYRVAQLSGLQNNIKSSIQIAFEEASTYDGNTIDITGSRDYLTVIAQATNGNGWGDVNGDGCVDILDLIKVVDHIVGRDSLDKTITPGFTTSEFERADIAPWPGTPEPQPDGFVNVQDLSVIQNIILTGFFPNGNPVGPCGYFGKSDGAADATVTLYINNEGISAYIDADIGIRGAQIEFTNIPTNPDNMIISTPLGQGYYLRAEGLLRTLMYDRAGQKYIDAGVNNFMADMPFVIANPNDVTVAKIVLVDINAQKLTNINIQTIYGTPTLPLDYILFQNYPNPFNPNTSVKFQVPKTSDVTIKVYDMLGQEVRTLFAGQVMRGTYTVDWDGVNNVGVKMSSGSYIYRMTAGEFVQSKKMILLK
jgi:hypothetical protein